MITRRALAGSLLPGLTLARPALAQPAWPGTRPIEMVVPYPAGGGIDIMARMVAKYLPDRLGGATIIVNNRVGAGGQIGNEAIFAARPDGHTIGAVAPLSFITKPLERSVRWRVEDFTYLAKVVEDPCAFWVRADSPLKSMVDTRAAAARGAERLSVGNSTGAGSDDHIILLTFEAATGVKCLHVPYNGTAQTTRDLLGGQLDVASYNLSEGLALLREGRTRCLGQASVDRWASAPEVPTFREQGMDILFGAARGFVGPPGLPAAITARLVAAFGAVLSDAAFVAEAERLGLPLRPMLGDDFRASVMTEAASTRQIYERTPWSSQN
ncbi:Bug family tripartite tricarboxylate transporter substrate binding protein [Roseomonas chloroacetimidivorans]|uniref:Bug family tripartite tricarboxylate transporter substrate binding protein n=1 Tax=Roseomonas chloroacetimidivorans TaxID=1766656 RepID=UPI003C774857